MNNGVTGQVGKEGHRVEKPTDICQESKDSFSALPEGCHCPASSFPNL